jgi:hypothetical protein
MNVFRFRTINHGYKMLVKKLLKSKDYQKISFDGCGKGTSVNKKSRYHLRNVHVMFDNPSEFDEYLVDCPKRSSVMNNYIKNETKLFDEGEIDSDKMGKISKIWKLIENPDNTINANYGHMVYHIRDAGNEKYDPNMMSQWEWMVSK